jgi:hypothetical protein
MTQVTRMPRADQANLFATEVQPELFGAAAPRISRADLDEVRARLHKILAEARAAQALPRDAGRLSRDRTNLPQMTFLPDAATQLRFAFDAEMTRRETSGAAKSP